MAEKVTSMRLNEEDLEQFKAFAKDNGLNQQQAFNSLIALAELEKAKDVLGDRAKSIDTFRDTINRALSMYVNALEENTTAEHIIREELSKELQTKDNTIGNLYEQLQEVKSENKTLKDNYNDIEIKNKELNEQLQKANAEITEKSKSIDVLTNNNINQLQQLEQYKDLKGINDKLVNELEQLKALNTSLDNNNKQLQDKINNNADMLSFYKDNISKLESSIESHKADIKAIEEVHKQQIQEVKEDNTHALNERIQATTEQLQSKHDVELAKKDLEIQKLQNEIEQLKDKPHRTASASKTK